MSDKKNEIDPRALEIKKLKDILRNQIVEIKSLKDQLEENASNVRPEVDTELINEQLAEKQEKLKEKYLSIIESKDLIIQDLKRDLKLNKREIETHLRRHSEELLDLHQQLISERTSRDFLLANITEELLRALKRPGLTDGNQSKAESKNAEAEELKIGPINQVDVPSFSPEDKENGLTILYASPQTPNFDESSGGKRAFLMLKLLAKQHKVYCYSKALSKELHKLALETEGVKVINKLDAHHIIERIGNIDIIIGAWYQVYDSIEPIHKYFPKAKLIIDTVDIHWVREERSLGHWDAITPELQLTNKQKEIEVYSKADVLWVVSEEDKKALKKEVRNADVRIVSNIHILKNDSYKADKPNRILFFGGYNHYPNINAVQLLTKNIFPKIKESIPDAELVIAGSNAPVSVRELGELDGVQYRGFIEHEEIKELYDNSKMTIIPLTEGAGIKGKICEAIEYRSVVITNDIGNEGIKLQTGVDGFVTNNYDEMAVFAIDIMKGKYDLELITKMAQEKMKELLGPNANLRIMNESFRPTVDICIVTYNKKELLENCITSILEKTSYPYYKILIYSNGCSDGSQEYITQLTETHENIEGILSDRNDVFVKPNNKMMLMHPAHDIVLLNNDVIVTENWLTALVEEAYKSRNIGIVGSKILYPDNVLQEFGSELYISGSGRNIGKGDDPNKSEYMYSQKAAYVSGCSMYIKRKTLSTIGVFDEMFHPCYAEDSDYCYTAWEKGIEVNVTPQSVIFHLEGASSGRDTDSGFKKFQKINMQKFLSKHADRLEKINEHIKLLNKEYPQLN